MNTVAKSDIFFLITSIAVILCTLIILVLIFFLIRIANNMLFVAKKIKEESENVSADIAMFRQGIRSKISENKFGLATIASIAMAIFGKKAKDAYSASKKQKASKSGSKQAD